MEDESENDAENVQSSQSSQSQCSRDVDHGDNNPSDNSVDTIRQCMREIRSELAGDINRLKSEVNVCLSDFGEKLQDLRKQVHLQSGNFSSNNRQANFQHFGQEGSVSPDIVYRGVLGNRGRNSTPENLENDSSSSRHYDSGSQHAIYNPSIGNMGPSGYTPVIGGRDKLRPQIFDGSEDLDEYLTQFNIISDLNHWDYKTKSLYLASSLGGTARALLGELDPYQRRDYVKLVEILKNRFGSVNRAEVFRSKLQSKKLGKNETIPELAQSIKSLTRKAYPCASLDVVEILALDHFIDAIPSSDIRLRLREVGPKSVSEAEQIAVRLEAHRIADRNRDGHHVRGLEPSESRSLETNSKLTELCEKMSKLVQEMSSYQSRSAKPNQQNHCDESAKTYSRKQWPKKHRYPDWN